MHLDRDDERVIACYLRAAHPNYSGPVFINLRRLEEIHMASSEAVVAVALVIARYESKEKRS